MNKQLIDEIISELSQNDSVKKTLSLNSRIYIDRSFPFIFVSRFTHSSGYNLKESELLKSYPSYMFYDESEISYSVVKELLDRVTKLLRERYQACLIVLVSSGNCEVSVDGNTSDITLKTVKGNFEYFRNSIEELKNRLSKIRLNNNLLSVKIDFIKTTPFLIKDKRFIDNKIFYLEILLNNFYFNENMDFLPLSYNKFKKEFFYSLQKSLYVFIKNNTNYPGISYFSLGKKILVKNVKYIDKQLSEIDKKIDFLLMVSPVNADNTWKTFKKEKFKLSPGFEYRPIPFDPLLIKRELFNIHIEKIEDPIIYESFKNKQIELDTKISMIQTRNTSSFLHGSLQIYGKPNRNLTNYAKKVIDSFKVKKEVGDEKIILSADDIIQYAEKEMDYYLNIDPDFDGKVEIKNDISGILVSNNRLMVSPKVKINKLRIDALIHHEIGVHILTYYNGKKSPLSLLSCGLDNYEILQEGLAVFAEFISGRLTVKRLRVLALRVLAVESMLSGVDFIETFEMLRSKRINSETAFYIAARVYRSGGYTKDYIYFAGFMRLIEYLKRGNSIENLFFGKYSFESLPFINELVRRKILTSPALVSRFLNENQINDFIDNIKNDDFINILKKGVV